MKVEAKNLQEAYIKAAGELDCSVADINIEVIQPPRAGVFGMFSKPGIFEAKTTHKVKNDFKEKRKKPNLTKFDRSEKFEKNPQKSPKNEIKETKIQDQPQQALEPKFEPKTEPKEPKTSKFQAYDSIISSFNDTNDDIEQTENIKQAQVTDEVLMTIRTNLINLLKVSSYQINVIDVNKFDDNTVFISLDGEDCALMIGTGGYRYKAFSYLLFNWINTKFGLNVRLEIAEFLKNQEVAIAAYLQNIIQKIQATGKAQTKPLDGVLVKIALEQLRAKFPDKYVGIKTSDEGRYVVVSDFYKK
nr:Jag N-terminal domain-containing protein [Campylobacter sp.]